MASKPESRAGAVYGSNISCYGYPGAMSQAHVNNFLHPILNWTHKHTHPYIYIYIW